MGSEKEKETHKNKMKDFDNKIKVSEKRRKELETESRSKEKNIRDEYENTIKENILEIEKLKNSVANVEKSVRVEQKRVEQCKLNCDDQKEKFSTEKINFEKKVKDLTSQMNKDLTGIQEKLIKENTEKDKSMEEMKTLFEDGKTKLSEMHKEEKKEM